MCKYFNWFSLVKGLLCLAQVVTQVYPVLVIVKISLFAKGMLFNAQGNKK